MPASSIFIPMTFINYASREMQPQERRRLAKGHCLERRQYGLSMDREQA